MEDVTGTSRAATGWPLVKSLEPAIIELFASLRSGSPPAPSTLPPIDVPSNVTLYETEIRLLPPPTTEEQAEFDASIKKCDERAFSHIMHSVKAHLQADPG